MIPQPKATTQKASQLKPSYETNVREKNNYDLETLRLSVLKDGRITKPLVIDGDLGDVLQGNRRARVAQLLDSDPNCPVEVKEALQKIPVLIYTGLTKSQREELIMDQGGEKPLCKTEVVNAVWKADLEFKDEMAIIRQLYFNLAQYTGKMSKLKDIPKEPKSRDKFLKSWFHGTVGNYILRANRMGEFVKQQFHLTHRADDGLIEKDADGLLKEPILMRTSRDRIDQLSKAITEDGDAWSYEHGGPKFNELIEKFKAEDSGAQEPEETKKRLTTKELNDRVNAFKHPATRKALMIAAGETDVSKIGGLAEDDARISRYESVNGLLTNYGSQLPEPLNSFVGVLLHKKPKEVEEYLQSLIAPK